MAAAEKPTVKCVDQIVLECPKGVYTGESRHTHKRSKSTSETNSDSVRECNVKKHRRAVSLEPYIRSGKFTTEPKDWTPRPLSDGTYGSQGMRKLCEEFGTLATAIVQGFAEGK